MLVTILFSIHGNKKMFFLVDKNDSEIKRSENRMALRRAKRKMKDLSLRIVEGATLKGALSNEKKAVAKKVAPAKKAPAVKKAVAKKAEPAKKAPVKKEEHVAEPKVEKEPVQDSLF